MDWGGSEFLLPPDVEEFRLEKNVKPEKQSQDEIEKLSVQEGLSETERVYLLVESAYDVQKIWAVEQLPTLLQNSGARQLQTALQTFIPKLKTVLQASTCSADVHAAASASLSSVVSDGLVTPQVFVTNFLPIVVEHFDSKNPAISSKWEETLLTSIPILPPEVLKHQVMLLARARGQLSQSISARQSCCRIIGKMAGRLEPYWVKQELLPLVRSLSQDVDHEVRSIMCQQLPAIATGLGLELCNTEMLPEVEKLLSDEMGGVRCSALTALTDLIPLVDKGTCQERVIPLAVKSIQAAAAPNEGGQVRVQRVKAAELIGRLCHQLKAFLTAEQSKTLLELYYQLASTPPDTSSSMLTPPSVHKGSTLNQKSLSSPQAKSIGLGKVVFTGMVSPAIEDDQAAECRRLCAYNLPAMVLFADSQANTLIPVLKSLASDSRWKVRKVIAAGIHELIPLLIKSQNTCKTITKEYIGLLKDKHPEVRQTLDIGIGRC